jgi:cytoskeletal protein CcmA (bactofilin family)
VSCPPEASLLLYVEEELAADERRGLESHLVNCLACRGVVVALRDESALIADALHERARETDTAREGGPLPEPGLTIGLPLAIAATTIALAVAGFLIEARLPGALDLLHPRRLMGASEMVFDLVFLLSDRAPGLMELALSFGALAAVSALGSFALGVLYRRVFGTLTLAIAALAIGSPPQAADALVMRFGEDTRVTADERIVEPMLLEGDEIVIDGTVEGDVVAAGERVTIGGTIAGGIYVFAHTLEIRGRVEGPVHVLADRVQIDGEAGGLLAGADEVSIGASGRIVRDATLLVRVIGVVTGEVGRDLYFAGEKLEVAGSVGRNVQVFWAEDGVFLRDGARIEGDVVANLEEGEEISRAPAAVVGGELRIERMERPQDHYLAIYREPHFYLLHALGFVASFVFGLVLHLVAPGLFVGELRTPRAFFRALGLGFVAAVVTPLAILVMALTVVGIPLAVAALFLFIGALYTAELAVGALIGRKLLPLEDASTLTFGRSFFVGLLLLVVASHLPFIGPPVGIVAIGVGLGLLVDRARAHPALRGG